MPSNRMRRINEAVREVVGIAISQEVKDPRIGFVTVTGAEVTPDLRAARVFVSVLGSEEEQVRTMNGLESAHGYLQSRVAAKLRLKHTPTLRFIYDDSIEKGIRISNLLKNE